MANEPKPPSGPHIDLGMAEAEAANMAAQMGVAETAAGLFRAQINAVAQQLPLMTDAMKEMVSLLKDSTSLYGETMEKLARITEVYQKLRVGGEIHNQQMRIDNEAIKHKLEMQKEELTLGADLFTQLKARRAEEESQKAQLGGEERARMVARKTADIVAIELTNIGGIIPKVLSNIPFGGIAMLLLHGVGSDAQWEANVNKVINQFARMGGGGDQFRESLKTQIKAMEIWNEHATQDLIAVSAQFAEAGVKIDKVWGPSGVGSTLSVLGANLGNVSLKFDYLNKQQAGWTAGMAKVAFRDMGNDVVKATETLVTYGMAAQSAGTDTVTFLSRVMQSAEGVKIYGLSLDMIAEQQLRLTKINQAAGLGGTDANKAFAGTLAAHQQQGAMAGMAQMSEGMAMFFGKNVIEKMGALGGDAADVIKKRGLNANDPFGIVMQTQLQGRDFKGTSGEGMWIPYMLKEMQMYMDQQQFSPGQQAKFWKSQGWGSWDAARGQIELMRTTEDPAKLSASQKAAINDAAKLPQSETSELTRALNRAVQGMKDLANGVLGMMLMALTTIVAGITALVSFAAHPWSGASSESIEGFKGAMKGFGEFATLSGGGLMNVLKGAGLAADSVPGIKKMVEILDKMFGGDGTGTMARVARLEIRDAVLAEADKISAPKGIDQDKWHKAISRLYGLMGEGQDLKSAQQTVAGELFRGAGFESQVWHQSGQRLLEAEREAAAKWSVKNKGYKTTVNDQGILTLQITIPNSSSAQENAGGYGHSFTWDNPGVH